MTGLSEKLDPKHCLVVVVDVQNDFCHPEGVMGKAGQDLFMVEEVMPRLVEVLEEARRVGVPIVFIQTIHSRWTDSQAWLTRVPAARDKIPQLCRPATWGADFYEVGPEGDERVVAKHRYSAFYGTDLDVVLRALGTKTLVMTGFATNVCVETTAREGFMRDYNVVFLSDCTGAYARDEHQAALINMSKYFGLVATSREVRDLWKLLPTARREPA